MRGFINCWHGYYLFALLKDRVMEIPWLKLWLELEGVLGENFVALTGNYIGCKLLLKNARNFVATYKKVNPFTIPIRGN